MPPPPFYNIRYRPEDPECDCDGIFTGTLFGKSHTFRHHEDCYKRLDIILDVANPKAQVIIDREIIIFCEYVGEMQFPEERKAAAQKLRLPPVKVSRMDTSEEQEESPAKEQETQDGFVEQCSESDDSISNQKVEKQADSEDLDKASAVDSTESEKLVLAVSSLKQELTKAEPSNASETPSLVSHYLPISPESSDHTGSSLLLDLEVSDSEDESEISSSNPSSVILSKENSMTSSSSVPSLTLPDGDEPVSNPSEELPSGAFSGLSVKLDGGQRKDVHSHIAKSHMLKNSRDKKSENHKVRGTKNNKIKLYRCSICNLESAWKKNIGRHNQGKHGGQAKIIIKRAKEEHDEPSYIDQEEQTQVSTLGGKNERKEEDEGCKVELETFATDRLKEQDPVSELPCDNTEEDQGHENVAVDTDSQNVTFKLYCKETAEEQTESRERKRSQSEYGEVKKSPKRERKRKRAREDGEDVTRPKSTNSIDTREEISLDGWTIIRYNT